MSNTDQGAKVAPDVAIKLIGVTYMTDYLAITLPRAGALMTSFSPVSGLAAPIMRNGTQVGTIPVGFTASTDVQEGDIIALPNFDSAFSGTTLRFAYND